MPNYAIYDRTSGEILRTVSVPADAIEMQVQDGEQYLECEAQPHDKIDVATRVVIAGTPPPTMAEVMKRSEKPKREPFVELRAKLYPTVGEQFDMLFKAIEAGQFGESARESQFYKRIKTVKDAVPKGEISDPALVYFMETIPDAEFVDPSMQASTTPSANKDAYAYLSRLAYTRKRKDKKK